MGFVTLHRHQMSEYDKKRYFNRVVFMFFAYML